MICSKVEELERLLKEAKQKLEEKDLMLEVLETTDELTKPLNRRTVFSQLEDQINRAKRYETPLSLLLLDIYDFKRIQDCYGRN